MSALAEIYTIPQGEPKRAEAPELLHRACGKSAVATMPDAKITQRHQGTYEIQRLAPARVRR